MANLRIAEFSGLASTDQGDSILAYSGDAYLTGQTVLIGTVVSSAAFRPSTKYVKLTAEAACSIAIGAAPTAVTGGWYLASGETLVVRVPAGGGYVVSVIIDAT